MNPDSAPLIEVTAQGLYCRAGDFYIDPWQPVQHAVITHGHADHLRHGSTRYILARPGLGIARQRLGGDRSISAVDYGQKFPLGSVTLSLHPAGHILGSSQIRIEHGERVWVVSGDYKRQPDPTCAPFEPIECDVFISEATFALPVYRWPRTEEVASEIYRWWQSNRERGMASVLFCYALGKAQRVLAELRAHTTEPVYVHGAVGSLVGVYKGAGVGMLPTLPVGTEKKTDYRGALIMAPPSAAATPWMRRFGEHATGFCSGWMRVRGDRRRRGYDRGFVISDHADWPGLIETCRATRAKQILLTHGYSDALTRYLRESGLEAASLSNSASAKSQPSFGAED
jgi:putative mRNA 3-end processing factor